MPGTHRMVLLALASAAGLLAPAGALAEVRCVPDQGPRCDSSHATIGGAVAVAGRSDTILIGPGTRMASITTSKRLRFEGAGAEATTIKSLIGPALRLRGGGTVTSLAARGGASGDHGAAAIVIDPDAVGKLAFHVEGVIAQGGDEVDPQGSPGPGLAVTADFNERPTAFVTGGTFRPGGGDGFFSAMSFAGDATRAELEGVVAVGLEGTGIRAASGDAELEMTETVASGGVAAALRNGDYEVRRSRLTGSLGGLCASDQGQQTSTVLLENRLVMASAQNAADKERALAAVSDGPRRQRGRDGAGLDAPGRR